VLYLDDGPVYVGNNVTIRGYSTIRGPCSIADGSVLDGAKLTHSSIGPRCRLSGEIEQTIFQGYANKQHEGFLGHSFIGEWVNLGAGTTNSDLKNNYKEVKVHQAGKSRATGSLKVGCFVGDHTKTGIGTLINTGSLFGSFCNLLGGKVSPAYLPAFVWDTGTRYSEYRIDNALETARVVMERRGVTLTPALEQAIRYAFSSTAREREDFLKRRTADPLV
jgi:UDP-N-acetylglucosamine diphosphorylase/glucosamine-1-phosphate N-acetyltransferase